jgi:hypothetical protein
MGVELTPEILYKIQSATKVTLKSEQNVYESQGVDKIMETLRH